MTKRTRLSLLYSGTSAVRWVQIAASIRDANLARQCVWRWKNASTARAAAVGERLQLSPPEYTYDQFERARK